MLPGQDLGSLRENTDQTQLRLEKTQACLRIGGLSGCLRSSPEERTKPVPRLGWWQDGLRPREFWG